MNDELLRFAIVGCGNIAQRHADAIKQYGRLVAVCDADAVKAGSFAIANNCESFTNISDLLNSGYTVQVVSICTPNWLHAQHALTFLKNGIHVICEKPMAISSMEAIKMIDAAKQYHLELFIVKQLRFYPSLTFIKELIDFQKLGTIYSFNLNCFWNRSKDYYTGWRGIKSTDGGTLYTQFSHHIDLILWLFGKVNQTQFISGRLAHPNIEFEDCGAINFKMATGAIGNFNYSVNAYQQNIENSITIIAEKGSIKLTGPFYERFDFFTVEEVKQPTNTIMHKQQSHFAVYDNIIKALHNLENTATRAIDSLSSIQLIEHIYANREWL